MLVERQLFPRLFLHFFDIHFLKHKGVSKASPEIKKKIKYESRLATRFSILASDEVYLPAASFFESDICFEILNELRDIYQFGLIRMIGGGTNLAEFLDAKLDQYSKDSIQFKSYKSFKIERSQYPPFFSRTQSASLDIIQGWKTYLEEGRMPQLVTGNKIALPKDFESRWEKVPEQLQGRAFIVEHVEPILLDNPQPGIIRNRLYGMLNENYFNSFTRELCSGIVTDMIYLEASHVVPSYSNDIPYTHILTEARKMNLVKLIENSKPEELLEIKKDPKWLGCLSAACEFYNRKNISINLHRNSLEMDKLAAATIGIITALPEEFAAICQVFQCDGPPINLPGEGAGRKYATSRIKTRTGEEHLIAIAMLTQMGNNSAAIRATQMLNHCKNMKHIIMTGIAGAVPNPSKPDDHVRLGDIVISGDKGVIQYDFDKESPHELEDRHFPRPPAAELLEAVRWLASEALLKKRPWDKYIDECIKQLGDEWRRPNESDDRLQDWDERPSVCHPTDAARTSGRPRIFQGTIASANKLLKNPVKRDALRDKYKVKAVEMEGSGIADATWHLDRGYLVIRGTCDYCNPDKGDVWHKYAAIIAAAYTRAVIEML
jgi:nucleoside phosphorylase